MTGTVSRTARVSIARWNLKEVSGKIPARRTEIAYTIQEKTTKDRTLVAITLCVKELPKWLTYKKSATSSGIIAIASQIFITIPLATISRGGDRNAKFLQPLHSINVESFLAAVFYLNGLSGQELIINY